MDNFQLSKQNALTKEDKSHEQKWDDKIKSLCDKINSLPNYFTTSSCSGRITIIKETNKKIPNAFIFKSHNKITPEQLKSNLPSDNDIYYLRAEPVALHIASKTLEDAQALLNTIRNAGLKKSGIISSKSHFIIEATGSEFLITPITHDLSENHLNLLTQEANKKLEQTWNKIEKLKSQIIQFTNEKPQVQEYTFQDTEPKADDDNVQPSSLYIKAKHSAD
jgi:tRNA wybutosine-synthesizing protein 3